MKNYPKVAVIGGGSWATALVKILSENLDEVYWWVRSQETIDYINKHDHNPNYLSNVELELERISVSNDMNAVVDAADYIILAIPSAFLKTSMQSLNVSLADKVVFSAIKGIVPEENMIVGEYLNSKYNVPYSSIGVITGPCHAEEVALERLSYLTIASQDESKAETLAEILTCHYIIASVSDDIFGTEYSAVLKNVVAIASGIAHGLGYGDNFQAVLVSNAIQEIKRFVKSVHPIKRDINDSAYLGDLLVTAYSQFSRNRTFGNMIGKGYTVKSAQLEMNMIAEGYYAVACVKEMKKLHGVSMPITKMVHKVLYQGKSPKKQMAKLAEKLR